MFIVMTIIVGFAMMTLGFALLVLGEVPFIAGRRIPALRSRLIGGVLVAFGPATWVVRSVTYALFGDAVEGPVVAALMFSFCCVVIFAILFRVLVPKREPRVPREPSKPTVELVKDAPFSEPEPPPPPASKKSPKAAKDGSSPFDFS